MHSRSLVGQAPSQMPGTILGLNPKCSTPKRRPFGGKGALTYPVQIIFIICTVYIMKIIYTTKRNMGRLSEVLGAWTKLTKFESLVMRENGNLLMSDVS